MVAKNSLVPRAGNGEDLLVVLESAVTKHGVSIQKMLNADASALSAGDMVYFDKSFFGRVPTYQTFMRLLKRSNPDLARDLRVMEAEALGDKYEDGMRAIYEKPTEEMDGTESKRFNWAEKLLKTQERKIDRLNKGVSEERGVDLAVKIISALSDAQLIKAKEVIEAEYSDASK